MGSSQSTQTSKIEEERKRRAEAERQELQQRAREEDRKRIQQDEKKKQEEKRMKELEMKRREEEELKRREAERENKLLEYKHLEEMQRINDLEQANQRKDTLTDKEYQLEHERLMKGQEQMFSILKDTFGKVKDVDINQAVYSAYIMQCIHTGKPIDKLVLEAVASKVPTPPPPNLEQIVENVIQKCEEADFENGYESNRSTGMVVSSDAHQT